MEPQLPTAAAGFGGTLFGCLLSLLPFLTPLPGLPGITSHMKVYPLNPCLSSCTHLKCQGSERASEGSLKGSQVLGTLLCCVCAFVYHSEAICTSEVRPGPSQCATNGRAESETPRVAKGIWSGAHKPHGWGSEFPKGAPHSGCSMERSSASRGKNEFCIIPMWPSLW